MRATYRVTAQHDSTGRPTRWTDALVVICNDDDSEAMAWTVPTPTIAQQVAWAVEAYLLTCSADDLHGLANHLSKVALLKAREEAGPDAGPVIVPGT